MPLSGVGVIVTFADVSKMSTPSPGSPLEGFGLPLESLFGLGQRNQDHHSSPNEGLAKGPMPELLKSLS